MAKKTTSKTAPKTTPKVATPAGPSLGNGPLVPELGIRGPLLSWLPKKPPLSFELVDQKSPDAIAAWQSKARKAFRECMGAFPETVPLEPDVLEHVHMDGYSRAMFTIATARGLRALCWFLIPDGVSPSRGGRLPAVIATPGHGIGAKDLIGLTDKGVNRQEGQGYQKDYALQAVRLGYPTLVIEPLGFGERRDHPMVTGKSSESGCQAAFAITTMLGSSLAAVRANDIMRGIDYLETLPQIDAKHVALMGISGGGQMTLWTTAIEPRIKAAVVSGYINTVRDSILGMHHCICNFIPGMAAKLDMPDLACLIAPRPLLLESGTTDPIFPIAATREAIKRIGKAYTALGVKDRFVTDIFEGDHQWSGAKVPTFLKRALG